VDYINVLIFGLQGIGKSSWINGVFTTFSDKIENPANIGYAENEHNTTSINRYDLGLNLPGCKLCFWDTWGLDIQGYQFKLLSDIMAGKVVDGFDMVKDYNGSRFNLRTSSQEDILSSQKHAVVFFVSQAITEDKKMLAKVAEMRKEIKEFNITPIIMVTKADEIALENHETERENIAKLVGSAPSFVHLISNYVKEKEKQFSIDKMYLYIVNKIMEQALQFIKYNRSKQLTKTKANSTLPVTLLSSQPGATASSITNQPLKAESQPAKPQPTQPPVKPQIVTPQPEPVHPQPVTSPSKSVKITMGSTSINIRAKPTTTFESILKESCRKFRVDESNYELANEDGETFMGSDCLENETELFLNEF